MSSVPSSQLYLASGFCGDLAVLLMTAAQFCAIYQSVGLKKTVKVAVGVGSHFVFSVFLLFIFVESLVRNVCDFHCFSIAQ